MIKAFRAAGALAVEHVRSAAVSIGGKDPEETRQLLQKCAMTTLNSKLVCHLSSPCLCCISCLHNPYDAMSHWTNRNKVLRAAE